MYSNCDNYDAMIIITNERFSELIRKEERLSVIERMLVSGEYVTVKDIKVVLGIKETEKDYEHI